jgi:hypothetical protein
MHRHRIRAFVTGSGETDVPVAIFAEGQFLRFVGGVVRTFGLGPGTTTINALATWGDTTGTQLLNTSVLLDNAGNMTQLVTLDGQDAPRITATLATATPTTGKLTTWASNSAPWKLDSTVTLQVTNIDGIDTLYGVGGINGRDPMKWVQGPASATDNEVPRYDGATGKLIQGSGVSLSDTGQLSGLAEINGVSTTVLSAGNKWLYGPQSTVINQLIMWDSTTGGLVKSAPIIYQDGTNTLAAPTVNATFLTLNGVDPASWVQGPASAALNKLATFSSTTGKVIQAVTVGASGGDLTSVSTINGIDPSTWVQGPASATDSRVALFNATSGKLIKQSAVAIDASGNMTGIGNINGRDPSRWLQGPTSSTNDAVVRFIGTTGQLATNSVVTIDSAGGMAGVSSFHGLSVPTNNWVRGPNFGTTVDRIATWNSTDGRVIKDSAVTLDSSGNVSNVTTLNGFTPSNWVRGPGSITADAIPRFTATNVVANSGATVDAGGNMNVVTINGRFPNELLPGNTTFFGGSTGFSPGYGLTKRASSYRVGFVAFVPVSFGDTTGTISLSMSSSDNNGEWMVQMPNASAARSLGVGGTWPNPGTFTSAGFIFAATCVVPAGSGIHSLNLNISSSGSMTMLTGWQMWTIQ